MKIIAFAKEHSPLGLMLVFPVLGALYSVVNKPADIVYSLVTPIDNLIPVLMIFAIPYSIWILYIYACLIYFYFKDRNLYYLTLVTYIVSALISYGIYSVFQTTVPRPVISGDDPLSSLVKYIYLRDRPYNCFPSIHVFSSYLMIRAITNAGFAKWKIRMVMYTISTLIILSTLFIKQHVLLDVVGGIVLAEGVFRLVAKLQNVMSIHREEKAQKKTLSA